MPWITQFKRVLQVGSGALFTSSILLAAFLGIQSIVLKGLPTGPFLMAQFAFLAAFFVVVAMAVGTAILAAWGAPAYVLLDRFGMANWWCLIPVGLLPGALLLNVARELGAYWMICGTFVACATHFQLTRPAKGPEPSADGAKTR